MEEILRNLLITAKEVRLCLEAELAASGGSLPIWLVLHTLSDSEGITQTQMATRINLETPTLTRHLDRLEAKGLIERRSDPEDRRVTRIYSSATSRRLHENLQVIVRCFEENLVRGLTDEQTAEFNRLLNQIKTNLTQISPDGQKAHCAGESREAT